jgi:uncharacterized protein (PEP-CTERM system associated)
LTEAALRHCITIRLILATTLTIWPLGPAGWSADLIVSNAVDFSVTATDNLDLDPPGQEQSALVATVTGLTSLRRQSDRLDLALDASLSLDMIAADSLELRLRPYLLGTGTAELLEDRLFVDASASVRRLLFDVGGRYSANDVSGRGNRTNVQSFSFSPYLVQHFGSWADAELRFHHTQTFYDRDDFDNSRSELLRFSARTGNAFSRGNLSGLAEYLNDTGGGLSGNLQRATATLSSEIGLIREFALLGTIGYERIETKRFDDYPDSLIWNVGFLVRPSPRTELRFTYGQRYGDDDIEASLHYRVTQRWTARASYGMSLQTTTQRTLDRGDLVVNPETGMLLQARTGLPIDLSDPGLGLTNDIFIAKRFDASLIGDYNRDRFILSGLNEKRDFRIGIDETISGAGATWTRALSPQMHLLTTLSYRTTETEIGTDGNDTITGIVQVSHRLAADVVARAALIRAQRFANQSRDEYTENALTLGIRIGF